MKGFVILLAGMLVFGLGLGGAFVAGTIVGGGDEESAATAPSIPAPASGGDTGGDAASFREQLRERIQSGELTPQEIAQLRQQVAGGAGGAGAGAAAGGPGGAGGGFAAGRALQGTIEGIEGNVITLNTFQGPIKVTIASEATIQVTKAGAIGDLSNGMTVAVTGERSDDGTFTAENVIGLPEGGFRGFGGAGRGAGGGGRGGFGGGGGGAAGGGGP